jgi:hypothetical protein
MALTMPPPSVPDRDQSAHLWPAPGHPGGPLTPVTTPPDGPAPETFNANIFFPKQPRRYTMTTQTHVTGEIVPENHRLAITAKIFGGHFPTILEPLVYNFTDKMAEDYRGGYWEFYTLSNGGFYLAPNSDDLFHVTCGNLFEGDLSADALGITVCLYAYSHLSFAGVPDLADTCNKQYHLLREYVFEHPEVRAILGATD